MRSVSVNFALAGREGITFNRHWQSVLGNRKLGHSSGQKCQLRCASGFPRFLRSFQRCNTISFNWCSRWWWPRKNVTQGTWGFSFRKLCFFPFGKLPVSTTVSLMPLFKNPSRKPSMIFWRCLNGFPIECITLYVIVMVLYPIFIKIIKRLYGDCQ